LVSSAILCHREAVDRRETERLVAAIRTAREAGEAIALATVVRVRGSAYRREGARMLIRADGRHECALSGGCLEPAVAEAAQRVIRSGEPMTATYDLAEDSIWGLGIGCMGAVDIRIERLDRDPVFDHWLVALDRGKAAVLVTPLAGVSGRLLVGADRTVLGALTDAALAREAVERARIRLSDPRAQSVADEIGNVELFFDVSTPAPPLVIFGAGHDAEPLARQAWTLGFSVTVVDVREAFLAAERFPGATLVGAHFSEFRERVHLESGSFVVIMNHHIERDRESLRFALQSGAAFVGLLGPRTRFEKLVSALATEGFTPGAAAWSRVRNPVGLAVGAETPEEIALAVLGEILALQRGFDGGFLAGRTASLHRPRSSSAFARS
jgi:xanthine/CO dehydrogenase XdhC/CoxF family maturation factor